MKWNLAVNLTLFCFVTFALYDTAHTYIYISVLCNYCNKVKENVAMKLTFFKYLRSNIISNKDNNTLGKYYFKKNFRTMSTNKNLCFTQYDKDRLKIIGK